MSVAAPAGVITMMFTDIQGSTELWEKLGDRFLPVLDRHNDLIRDVLLRWGGYEVKSQGDSFMAAFPESERAVRCSLDIQRTLSAESWPAEVGDLRVRIGMHTGEPFLGYDPGGRPDYFGPVVNRAARVSSAGHGGQTLISGATRELLHASGNDGILLLDLGTYRLRGLEQPELLFQVTAPDLPAREFPPLKTLDTVRSNLPAQPPTFVGRGEELGELRRLLRRTQARLVTLVGFGGMGKTRTALQLAELCVDDYADGVWWIELDQVRTGERIFERIAYDMRIHLQPQPSVKEQVLAFLRTRKLLLVLDNTEQIPDAAGAVRELLNAAPGLRCVVTSRRALELPTETRIEIPPLPPAEAEMLFVERARARQADFEPGPENAADIAELCRRLEGVPLAIELAASRIVAMTPREILSRLDARFRLLQTRSPELPARQRALRGAIDWSYELLSDEDRYLFGELSVFVGGFSLEDAEAVSDGLDVFEGVMELRRHSLLRTELEAASQRTRYVMLESVREYAAEKLAESPDVARAVNRRHADYFLRLAEARATRMRTCEECGALADLDASLGNIRAAMRWTRENGEGAPSARLALALFHLLYCRGFWDQARRVLESASQALETAAGDTSSLRAAVEYHLASLFYDTRDWARARELAERSLERRRELANPRGEAETLNLLGLIVSDPDYDRQDPELAHRRFQDALALLAPEDHCLRGILLHNLGRLASLRGQSAEAARLYEEALGFRRLAGHLRGEAETLGNLGVLAHYAGDFAAARTRYLESIALQKTLGDRHGAAIILDNLGEILEQEGDPERAALFFYHSERLFRDLPSPYASTPAAFLEALSLRLPPERWSELMAQAGRMSWEDLV